MTNKTSQYIKKGGVLMVKSTITINKQYYDLINNYCAANNLTKSMFLQILLKNFFNKKQDFLE